MMKKIYNSPETTVYKVRVQHLLSLSNGKVEDGTPTKDDDANNFSKGSHIWDSLED